MGIKKGARALWYSELGLHQQSLYPDGRHTLAFYIKCEPPVGLLLPFRCSTKAISTKLHLLHAIVVSLHVHKFDVVILTPETVFLAWWMSSSPSHAAQYYKPQTCNFCVKRLLVRLTGCTV